MFVQGTIKKAGILLTLSFFPLFLGYFWLSFVLASFTTFMIQFFRDPKRKAPSEDNIIVAPADGRILKGRIDKIKTVTYDEPLMSHVLEEGQKGILISTFMSPFDVHVNRVPVSGKVTKSEYYPGKFKLAWKSIQKENEKNLIVIDSKYGKVGVVQIAGFIARRIIQYIKVGDMVQIGEKLGMIKFGSRVDLILPYENCRLMVREGEKPKAGETIVAKMIG